MARWPHVAVLLCMALSTAGCTVSDSRRYDPVRSVWGPQPIPAPTDRIYDPKQLVFFATDRGPPVWKTDFAFGPHWSGILHCGSAQLQVPLTPSSDDKAPSIPLPPLSPQACATKAELAAFAARVAQAAKGCGHVLLMVHGYNTSFRTAILRAGQVAHDMAWPCPVLLFSWSSEGQADRYAADVEHSSYAVPFFTGLLKQLHAQDEQQPLAVDVLAHSMGNRLVLSALAPMCRSRTQPLVQELIMAAADVGAESENDDFKFLLGESAPCLKRATIYASDNDMALLTSESVHGGIPRAGRRPQGDMSYAVAGVDVVDASQAPSGPAGHGYFSLSYEMIQDMRWVLNGAPLEDRIGKTANDGLNCAAWNGKDCPQGRYALSVAPSRRPPFGLTFFRKLWPH
jgi:esterase/lipase superfamily enzyme